MNLTLSSNTPSISLAVKPCLSATKRCKNPRRRSIVNRFSSFFLCLVVATPQILLASQDAGNLDTSAQREIAVYTVANIITMNPDQPNADALAIQNDRIIAVGSLQSVKTALGDNHYRLDQRFEDKVLVPGFINQHDHPWLAALTLSTQVIAIEDWEIGGERFPRAANELQYQQRLTALVNQHQAQTPNKPFVSWGYHQLWHGELNRTVLDSISTEIPIIIWQRSAHELIFNTPGLKYFNINPELIETFPITAQAQSDLDKGHFWEQGAMQMVPHFFKVLAEPRRFISSLKKVRNYWHAAGSTLVVEPGGLVNKDLMAMQNRVFADASNPFHMDYIVDGKTMAAHYLDGDMIGETEKLLDWGEGMSRFMPKQIKLFADGAVFSQLMKMKDGYLDGHHGEWIMEPEKLEKAFAAYWDAGYQIHVHQNGDAGLDVVLDIIEANLKRNPREDHRTVIVHFGFSTPEQVNRIAQLDVIVSANPYYTVALADTYSKVGIGPERAQQMVRLGDVANAGISLSLHADMPMAPGKPLFLMWSAVNRMSLDGNVIGANQRLTPYQALHAVTLGAAYSMKLENELGSIETGKFANITVLEANPLSVDPNTIKDIPVWGTLHEGRVLPVKPDLQTQRTAHTNKQ